MIIYSKNKEELKKKLFHTTAHFLYGILTLIQAGFSHIEGKHFMR